MSLETEIREAFERHAGEARPRPEAWVEVEQAIGRSHRRRMLVASLGTAATIAIVAMLVPRITSDGPNPPIVPGPVNTVGWVTFESTDGYRLNHPSNWSGKRDGQTDVTTFVPDDVARDDGKPLFSLDLAVKSGDYEEALIFQRKAPEFQVTTGRLEGGYAYVRVEHRRDGNVSIGYSIDWTTPLCPLGAPCPRPAEGSILDVTISASTPVTWERYGPTAERIVQTIRAIPPSQPGATPTVIAKIPVGAMDLAVAQDTVWALQRAEVQGEPGRLVRIDPRSNRPDASVEIGVSPTAVAADADAVWVANGVTEGYAAPFPSMNSVMRVDPRTMRVVATIRVRSPLDVAVGTRGTLWVTAAGESNGSGITLLRIDPETNEIFDRITLPGSDEFAHIAIGQTSQDGRPEVWVTTVPGSSSDRTLLHRVDASNKLLRTIEIPAGEGPAPLAVGLGSIWVAVPGSTSANALARIDPVTERVVATVTLPDAAPIGIASVTTGEGYVWATGGRGSLWRVDPRTNSPLGDPLVIGDDPPVAAGGLVYGINSLWVASGDMKIWRLEP